MVNLDIQRLDANIQRGQDMLKLGAALERLKKNPDFKTIVTEGYLRDEAIRLVHARRDPNLDDPQSQASLMTQVDAIACLVEYLRSIEVNAERAAYTLPMDEETREAILAEELE